MCAFATLRPNNWLLLSSVDTWLREQHVRQSRSPRRTGRAYAAETERARDPENLGISVSSVAYLVLSYALINSRTDIPMRLQPFSRASPSSIYYRPCKTEEHALCGLAYRSVGIRVYIAELCNNAIRKSIVYAVYTRKALLLHRNSIDGQTCHAS